MELINNALKKIGSGIAYGIGFGIMIFVFSWAAGTYLENEMEESLNGSEDSEECRNFKKCEESSGLELEITSERINEDFVLLGKIKNTGNIKWTSVTVKAELFDKGGQFVDECNELVDQKVFPGKEVNFKLECAGCSKPHLEGYASYKAIIIDGNTW